MCLKRLTKKVTLLEDITVYKVVTLRRDGELFNPYTVSTGEVYNYKLGVNKANTSVTLFVDDHRSEAKYESGFHCYTSMEGVEEEFMFWENYCGAVLTATIPRGTVVQYGQESKYTVVVTPVLVINELPKEV